MRKILLPLLGLFVLFSQSNFAQSELDTVLVKAASTEEPSLDDKINSAIQPVTSQVEKIIFYSFKLKEEIQYKKLDDTSYTKEPPFLIEYDGSVPFGSAFTITEAGADQYKIEYGHTDDDGNEYSVSGTFGYGEKVDLGEFSITTTSTGKAFDGTYTFTVNSIGLPFVLIWLILGAVIFTLYFKFFNVTGFKLAIDVVRGKYTDPKEKGEVSHFQALTTALSGTVGLGNIAGVAVAIAIGGPGATFWMILAGILGMSSKFVECTLGVTYRNVDADGKVHGGPMYYLSKGLKEKGMAHLGKFCAIFFAIMCIGGSFGGGNMFQINQAVQQFEAVTGGEKSFIADYRWAFGLVIALIVGVVIIGGIKRIAQWTDKIVPAMCGIYVLAALIIIFMNAGEIPNAFGLIFSGAFAPTAVAGGVIGALIQGFRRAAFSNEAGIGSASIAHAAVKTNNPASEGVVALLEPFIDTIVVCTMTALVLIITGYHDFEGASGVGLTSVAFSSQIPFFEYILSIAVILFAFSTMIAWAYYGLQSWYYLVGVSETNGYIYKFTFCGFVILGAAMELGPVIGFSDAMIFAMCFPNVIGLVILMPKVKEELARYLGKIKSGEIIRH